MSWKWKLSVLFVLIVGFSTLIFMGHQTSTQAPPIPNQILDKNGQTIFTGNDILAGQSVFQKYGLMDVGSIFGHRGYNGPDFSADYLHRQAVLSLAQMAEQTFGKPYEQLSVDRQNQLITKLSIELKQNNYSRSTGTLTWTDNQVSAYKSLVHYYDTEFGACVKMPLPPEYIKDSNERLQLSRFFAWTAWVCSTNRPGKDYTYTNNWPPEQLVGNSPNWQIFLYSAMSLIMLVGGIGLTQFLMSAFPQLGWAPNGTSMTDNVKSFQPSRSPPILQWQTFGAGGLYIFG